MLASKHAGRIDNDDYDTCPRDLQFMLSLCNNDDVVWDPFVCDGFSQRYMTHLGYAVYESDVDFFDVDSAPEVTKIVTNPPFSNKQRVLQHLVQLGIDFVLLVPSTMITTNYFNDAINSTCNTHEWSIYIPNKVVKYHVGGQLKTGCPFNSMFVTCTRRSVPVSNQSVKDTRVSMVEYVKQSRFVYDGPFMGEEI